MNIDVLNLSDVESGKKLYPCITVLRICLQGISHLEAHAQVNKIEKSNWLIMLYIMQRESSGGSWRGGRGEKGDF